MQTMKLVADVTMRKCLMSSLNVQYQLLYSKFHISNMRKGLLIRSIKLTSFPSPVQSSQT